MSDPNRPVQPVENSQQPPVRDAAQEAADRRKILIGSQRDPAAYRPKRNDWTPIESVEQPEAAEALEVKAEEAVPAAPQPSQRSVEAPVAVMPAPIAPRAASQPSESERPARRNRADQESGDDKEMPHPSDEPAPSVLVGKIPPPRSRDQLSPDMEDELLAALGGAAMEDLLTGKKSSVGTAQLELDSKTKGRVVAVRRGEAFVELGAREQGLVSLRQFGEKAPAVGDVLDVVVHRFNAEEGLYELSLVHSAMRVSDWGDLTDGMIVEAKVTGHNAGGLECEVNHIRGFIPISQIALYRVEDIAQFVGQSFTCLVTEANPERRNLVLSRRALLEREKEETQRKFLESLAPGQIYDGVVRKLMDFGAFVDIGGADGLVHISQLAWHRVNHPSEVLTEGQRIKVRVEKYDAATGKIGLSYRELFESPWVGAAKKYTVRSTARGKVTRLMEFGAFVELEPGVEGLVHISELAHKRLYRASDAVKVGEEVDVLILSVDPDAQRMSLSIKALSNAPEKVKKDEEPAEDKPDPAMPKGTKSSKTAAINQPLRGGTGRGSGGDQFGLNW